jgi:hypothetical protein
LPMKLPLEILEGEAAWSRRWKSTGNSPDCSLLKWRSDEDSSNWACLAPCMPAGMLSETQHKGLFDLSGMPVNDGIGIWPSKGKSGGCGSLNFFLGGEKGERWMAGMFDTSSANHGLTRFTFCSRSGSSHATWKMKTWKKI